MVVTLSHTGYYQEPAAGSNIERKSAAAAASRRRRPRKTTGSTSCSSPTRTTTSSASPTLGRVYWLKVWEVPQGSRASRGRPIVNMFPLQPGEKVNVVLPLTDGFRSFPADHYIFMATAQGVVKKTSLDEFSNPRKAGIIAVDLDPGDFPDRRRADRRHSTT